MAFEMIAASAGLALGIGLMVFSSQKAGEHSISLAETLGTSPFIIGLLLVSIGTDLPEMFLEDEVLKELQKLRRRFRRLLKDVAKLPDLVAT